MQVEPIEPIEHCLKELLFFVLISTSESYDYDYIVFKKHVPYYLIRPHDWNVHLVVELKYWVRLWAHLSQSMKVWYVFLCDMRIELSLNLNFAYEQFEHIL